MKTKAAIRKLIKIVDKLDRIADEGGLTLVLPPTIPELNLFKTASEVVIEKDYLERIKDQLYWFVERCEVTRGMDDDKQKEGEDLETKAV